MHQISCRFFKIYPGATPPKPLFALGPRIGPPPLQDSGFALDKHYRHDTIMHAGKQNTIANEVIILIHIHYQSISTIILTLNFYQIITCN